MRLALSVFMMLTFLGCKTGSSGSDVLENGNPSNPTAPVSVVTTCTIHYSDNFLGPSNAKTKILCEVTGKGAVGWRVTANGNNYQGWSGTLDRNLDKQTFETAYIKVGGDRVPYHVYVADVGGGEKLRKEFNTGGGSTNGPINLTSNSCIYKSGGNFFTPETYAVCNIVGKGAEKYMISIVDGNGQQKIIWEGDLNPQKDGQQIDTRPEQKFLGSFSSMNVTIIDVTNSKWNFNAQRQ